MNREEFTKKAEAFIDESGLEGVLVAAQTADGILVFSKGNVPELGAMYLTITCYLTNALARSSEFLK